MAGPLPRPEGAQCPWLTPIEPRWGHTERQSVAPARLLPAREVAARVCAALACTHHEHIPLPEKGACSCTSQPQPAQT